jgi:hypothetical protein
MLMYRPILGKAFALRNDRRSIRRPGNSRRANAYAAGTQRTADRSVATGAVRKLIRIALVTSELPRT